MGLDRKTRNNHVLERIEKKTTAKNRVILKYIVGFYRQRKKSESTVTNYLNIMDILTDEFPKKWFLSYKKEDVEVIINKLNSKISERTGKPLAETTYSEYCGKIRYFFTWLDEYKKGDKADFSKHNMKNKVVPVNVRWIYKPPAKAKEKEFYSEKLIKKIMHVAEPKYACFWAILEETGCRYGSELLKVQIGDIKKENNFTTITLHSSKTLGGRRKIYIIKSIPYLQQWINSHPLKNNPDAPLFITRRRVRIGNKMVYLPISKGAMYIIFSDMFKKIGEKFRGFHILRHMRATAHANAQVSNPVLNKLMGWSASSNTSMRYTHIKEKDVQNFLLEQAGVEVAKQKDTEMLKPRQCSNCGTISPGHLSECFKCMRAFTEEATLKQDLMKQVQQQVQEQMNELKKQMFLERNQIKSIESIPEGEVWGCETKDGKLIRANKRSWIDL